MYVAMKELKVFNKETRKLHVISPGEPVLDFENWDIHARKAHLNLEWVKKVEPADLEMAPTKQKKQPPKKKASKKE